MPFELPSMPFMNFGPNIIARLTKPLAASFASVNIKSAVAAFSSAEAPAPICCASTTPLRPVRIPDSTNEIASQITPTTLRMRAMPETAAPIGGKIMPSKPITVRIMPSLPQTLPTIAQTLLTEDRPVMIPPRTPWTLRYGLFAHTADASLPTPRKFADAATACSMLPPCAT